MSVGTTAASDRWGERDVVALRCVAPRLSAPPAPAGAAAVGAVGGVAVGGVAAGGAVVARRARDVAARELEQRSPPP